MFSWSNTPKTSELQTRARTHTHIHTQARVHAHKQKLIAYIDCSMGKSLAQSKTRDKSAFTLTYYSTEILPQRKLQVALNSISGYILKKQLHFELRLKIVFAPKKIKICVN